MTRPTQRKHQTVPPWASPSVDQRIIEAVVAGDMRTLGDLTAQGISQDDIYTYARSLGAGDRFIKDCRLGGSSPKMRACMKCESRFASVGMHNRLCRRCRGR